MGFDGNYLAVRAVLEWLGKAAVVAAFFGTLGYTLGRWCCQ